MMRWRVRTWSPVGGMLLLLACGAGCSRRSHVTVGSKVFTESVILGQTACDLARSTGADVDYRRQLGGTRLVWSALLSGQVDLYPEYTGTLSNEIFAGQNVLGEAQIRRALSEKGIEMTRPLGFSDTYAIGMREELAKKLNINTISDLRNHPDLRFGFSNEFLDRGDGWPALRTAYGLSPTKVTGLDHDLAYRALANGNIDVTDLYSTDAEIEYYHLRVLTDDRQHFPEYQAVFVYRADLRQRAPEVVDAIKRLEGRITQSQMIKMNADAKVRKIPEDRVASQFLSQTFDLVNETAASGFWDRLGRRTWEHLQLVGVSLLAAILAGIPLGVVAAAFPRVGQIILGSVAAIYTIPSLALLVFMLPLLGIGWTPAVFALFLYSLLPIVRNTHAGLRGIATPIRDSAAALGLPAFARLMRVELPLASPSILAGIQTSAVLNVGTATLGALIGAGGYGQPILTGIRLNSPELILEGAIPAAILALAVQGLAEIVGWVAIPRGLRLKRET
ncbi:MAG TPA: glycine betaine ABC transporter substrate-binding protein [Tepidisphaeraceae bacterium]|nr:glycine betaine ABC transporter substrate-binding protein [Tepidisphaeraceae bacterium]